MAGGANAVTRVAANPFVDIRGLGISVASVASERVYESRAFHGLAHTWECHCEIPFGT